METGRANSAPRTGATLEGIGSGMESIKAVRLRLLMEEREQAARKLARLDNSILVLEEYFRARHL